MEGSEEQIRIGSRCFPITCVVRKTRLIGEGAGTIRSSKGPPPWVNTPAILPRF